MKKSLFFVAAASALMLTACSSENDVLQSATPSQPTTVQQQAVGFDIYTPAATNVTRAGQAGTMTTGRLQRTPANDGGFGVYAYLVEDVYADAGQTSDASGKASSYLDYGESHKNARTTPFAPNFMVNQKVEWNSTNQGWKYEPLKYWPNETDNDSQDTNAEMEGDGTNSHLDRLTFFAYAPYVTAGVDEPGITLLTNKAGDLVTNPTTETTAKLVEASVGYKTSLDEPTSSVDLLWGVAPAGGLSYTAVNGRTVNVPEGQPLMDMTKPNVNTSMKFLFQHALARIGVNVVAAVDQVGAGGELDNNTRITIDNVTLTGKFGATGVLNLDNPKANIAHWVNINTSTNDNTITSSTKEINGTTTLILSADAGTIAPSLRYVGEHTFGSYSVQNTGVTTTKQDLITPRYFKLDAVPEYSPSKQYYTNPRATYTITGSEGYYKLNGNNYDKISSGTITDGTNPGYVTLTVEGPYAQSGAMPDGAGAKRFYKLSGTTYQYIGPGSGITWNATGTSTVYYLLTAKDVQMSDIPFESNDKAVATYTVKAADNIYTLASEIYAKVATSTTLNAPTIGTSTTEYYKLEKNGAGIKNDISGGTCPDGKTQTRFYTVDENGVFTYANKGKNITWNGDGNTTYYEVTATPLAATDIAFAYSGDIYDVERNYFMVIPTNNVALNTGVTTAQDEELRKVRVKIEYYVTTTDDNILGGRTQTKNVIEKDVLFPSLANGKSYNLNLVLGLTSVKMEAEVDDWKVINVQADLPQNTAD